jgi:sulfoxide reductase heme-binding subunit YedZ
VSRRARIALKSIVWVAGLAPIAWLAWRVVTGTLGAEPIAIATRALGDWTLRCLLASLAMTPLRLVTGLAWPATLRRLLGLFAFFYLVVHFLVWIVADHLFDWAAMGEDILKRPFITAGSLGLLCLIPLAATSTAGMVKRLGARTWKRLHRLAYVAGVLGVVHYLWLVKPGTRDPYWYAAALTVLLGVRAGHALRARRRGARAPVGPPAGPRPVPSRLRGGQ